MKSIISICVATLVAICATAQEKKPCKAERGAVCAVCEDDYPALAKAQRLEGKVVCRAIIDEKGQVQYAEVVKPYNPILDEKALEIVSTNKMPIRSRSKSPEVIVSVSFKLSH